MVRDIKNILETLQEQEQKQQENKVELIDNCFKIANIVRVLGVSTAETSVALDEKINVIKDFIVRQAEEITALRLRVNNLEEVMTNHENKLNAKN